MVNKEFSKMSALSGKGRERKWEKQLYTQIQVIVKILIFPLHVELTGAQLHPHLCLDLY